MIFDTLEFSFVSQQNRNCNPFATGRGSVIFQTYTSTGSHRQGVIDGWNSGKNLSSKKLKSYTTEFLFAEWEKYEREKNVEGCNYYRNCHPANLNRRLGPNYNFFIYAVTLCYFVMNVVKFECKTTYPNSF